MSSRFLKNTIYGVLSAMSVTLGGFVISLLVARLLGVAQTGIYTFAIWIVMTSAAVTGIGLPFTMSRYLPEALERSGRPEALRLARCYLSPSVALNLVPLLAAVAYAIWLGHADRASGSSANPLHDPILWVLVGACCSVQAMSDYTKGYLRGMHSLERVAKLSTLSVILQIAFVITGTLLFGVRGTLAGFCLGSLLPLVALTDLLGAAPIVAADTRRRVWVYSLNRWVSEIAGALVFARIEVFYLQLTASSTQVGLLSAAIVLANLATIGPMLMTWGLLPHLTEQHARRDERALKHAYLAGTRLMALMVFPACLGLAAILPELVPMLFGESFAAATPSAIWLVIAASGTALALIGNNIIWATERAALDVRFGILGFIASVCIGLPLTAKFGLSGAVAARIVTQLLIALLTIGYIVLKMRFGFPLANVTRVLFAALACAIAAKGVLLVGHGLEGLVAAIAAGALAYVAAIGILRPLEREDAEKLSGPVQKLPRPLAFAGERALALSHR